MHANPCVSLAMVGFVLCGCAGVKVKDGAGNDAKDVNGIPFYVKVPWRIQQTELASREMLVTFVVTEISMDPGTGKSTETRNAKLPAGATLRLNDTEDGHDAVNRFMTGLDTNDNFDKTVSAIETGVSRLAASVRSTQPATDKSCKADNFDVIANSWSTEMRAGTRLYYLEPQNPFIGSASADIHLGPDGTLSESSTSVTDNTASTLLSLIPVSALLSKAWGLPADAAAAAAAPAASAANNALIERVPAIRAIARPEKSKPVVHVRVDVVETPVRTLYQLRRARPLDGGAPAPDGKPLNLCEALGGKNDTELVSVTMPSAPDDDKGGGKNAWQIAGQLVPPKPDKSDKAGTTK